MKKYITILLVLIFLITTHQALAISPMKIIESQTQLNPKDTRVKILEAYFEKYHSALQPEAINFVEAADKYNIDWKLVAAISGVESTFGKHTPGFNSYNAWGWGVYGTQALYFKSWKDGIYTVSEGLRMHYYNKGLTNTYSIAKVYAASPTWGAHVTFFLNDMAKFEKDYIDNQTQNTVPNIKTQTAGSSAIMKAKS